MEHKALDEKAIVSALQASWEAKVREGAPESKCIRLARWGKDLSEPIRAMIFSKWLRSLRYGNTYFKLIESDSYYAAYHKYIERVLAKPSTLVTLAVLPEDTDVVLGFCISDQYVVHYVHVHKDFRRLGLASYMLPPKVTCFTHLTKSWFSIWHSKFPKAVFDPFFER